MNRKFLLPVFLLVMTATAAEVTPKPAKVVGQQQEEDNVRKIAHILIWVHGIRKV